MSGGGFGHGPFGHEPFGEANWSRLALYEQIPELYRSQDEEGHFRNFIEALYPSFDRLRRGIRAFDTVREPRRVRSQYDSIERLRLGPIIVPQGGVEQQGIDGSVNALFEFAAATGRFRDYDRGKELIVRGSTIQRNNRSVTIITIVNLSTVVTDPSLATDGGPLKWELREKREAPEDYITIEMRGGDVSGLAPGWIVGDGIKDFTVRARRQFDVEGLLAAQTEREGSDGTLDGSLRFASSTGSFTTQDVGKFLSISGSSIAENNGKFEIFDIDLTVSPPRLTLRGFMTADTGPLVWAVLRRPQLDLEGLAVPKGVVEQEGLDLVITTPSTLSAASAAFTSADVDKWIRIRGSLFGQDRQVRVTAVSSLTTVTVDSTFSSAESNLFWELRTATVTDEDEKRGNDAEIVLINSPVAGQSTLLVPSASFDPTDDGLVLELSNSSISGNNGDFTIASVIDETHVAVLSVLTFDPGPLNWRVLSGDFAKVEAHPQSLIVLLAPDFGITIDTQESDTRQRSYLEHVNAWLDLKGHETAYDIIGTLAGFDTTVQALYHIDPDYIPSLPSSIVIEVGEVGAGRLGNDGVMTLGPSGRIRFTSASALFVASDVGRSLRINNAADALNNDFYTIDVFVDAQTVECRITDVANSLPEYGVLGTALAPTLLWILVRFFSTQAPLLPRFDEINADQMTEYIAATAPTDDAFAIDKFCWETAAADPFGPPAVLTSPSAFAAFVNVTVVSVVNLTGGVFRVTVSGPADVIPRDPAGPTRQVLPGVIWVLIDSASNRFVLETVPEPVGPNFSFEIVSTASMLPVVAAARLEYVCSIQTSCEYCAASAVAITLELGSVATETGVAIERVLERVLIRENEEPKPAHVRLILILRQILEARLSITAEIDAGLEIFPTLYAPVCAYYDDIVGDDLIPDACLMAEVETSTTLWVGGSM
jgi:hypothetical protein